MRAPRNFLPPLLGGEAVPKYDSVENGEREISLWFGGTDTVEWEPTMTPWIKELS